MANKGGGSKPDHDYALLLSQFEADYAPLGKTLSEFAKEKDIAMGTISAAFIRERKRTAMGVIHGRNKTLGIVSQRIVLSSLAKAQNDPNADPLKVGKFALEVFTEVMQREEPNPLLMQQFNLVLPPMFAEGSAAQKAIEALTGKPAEQLPKVIEAKPTEAPHEQVERGPAKPKVAKRKEPKKVASRQ